MADATPVLGLPFDEGDDAPNGPAGFQALAEAVEGVLVPPGLASGQGLLWNGSEWVATDLATQAELGAYATSAAVATAVSDHSADTTGVHGIPDTADLAKRVEGSVAAFPGSPLAGDEVVLQTAAMAAMSPPVAWRCWYDGTRWWPVGPMPLFAEVAAEASTTSTSYAALSGSAGPSIALPVPGDYDVETGCAAFHAAAGQDAYMSYDIGGTAASDNDRVGLQSEGAASALECPSTARTRRKSGLGAVTLTSKYKSSSGASAARFGERFISATPRRF